MLATKLLQISFVKNFAKFRIDQQRCNSTLISQESFSEYTRSKPIILAKVFKENERLSLVTDKLYNIIEYNSSGGKLKRELLTLYAFEQLADPVKKTAKSLEQIRVLAWAVEMTQGYITILDDICDKANTRRGKPCWYLLPEVGRMAVNDACLFRSFIYELLRVHFGSEELYREVVNLFDKAFLYTSMGQELDNTKPDVQKKRYDTFTMDRYNQIIEYKTAYYCLRFPISLAMTVANNDQAVIGSHLDDICKDIGRFMQMQNDYMDCYGDPEAMGTDIQEGKCTWLAVQALQRFTPEQRVVFNATYGSVEPAHFERIKFLYDKLGMKELYVNKENDLYDNIVTKCKESNGKVSTDFLINYLDAIRFGRWFFKTKL